jgi:serine/threonine-protein kinase HipA
MPSPERYYAVEIGEQRAGVLHVRDDYTSFVCDAAYVNDPLHQVLGLRFEEDLKARYRANLRLPPWFSNLLPEGRLREWIANARGVTAAREMQLLAHIGHDLPGAVRISETNESLKPLTPREPPPPQPRGASAPAWAFSLAGVQLKFSMLQRGDRLTAPARGELGDWIVKLPDASHRDVPLNEHAMMELARAAGLDVPEIRLVPRELISDLPEAAWPPNERLAFAVRRFDRAPGGARIHIEDLAQVRGFYPDAKYAGSYETAAALVYRRRDLPSLRELARRLAFAVFIRNGDAHLKNFSLRYVDPRVPILAPAYDLVATSVYTGQAESLALRLDHTKRFEQISPASFLRLGERLGADGALLAQDARDTVERGIAAWPRLRDELLGESWLRPELDAILQKSAARFLAKRA